MELPDKTQAAYDAWKAAKANVKIARDAVKQAQQNDRTLMEAEEAKKLAAEQYKSERFQWDGKHEHLLNILATTRQEEKELHAHFTDCYTTAMQQQLAFDLFDEGRKVEVIVSTKAKLGDVPKSTTPNDHADTESD